MITAEAVKTKLEKYGVDAVITAYPSAIFEPTTNKVVQGTPVQKQVKAVPPYANREGYREADLINSGKGLTGISSYGLGSFVIKSGLKITINNVDWTITGVTPISTKDGVVYYQLEIET